MSGFGGGRNLCGAVVGVGLDRFRHCTKGQLRGWPSVLQLTASTGPNASVSPAPRTRAQGPILRSPARTSPVGSGHLFSCWVLSPRHGVPSIIKFFFGDVAISMRASPNSKGFRNAIQRFDDCSDAKKRHCVKLVVYAGRSFIFLLRRSRNRAAVPADQMGRSRHVSGFLTSGAGGIDLSVL